MIITFNAVPWAKTPVPFFQENANLLFLSVCLTSFQPFHSFFIVMLTQEERKKVFQNGPGNISL